MMTYTMMRQPGYTPADCVRVAAELKMDGIDWVTTYGEDPKLLKKMSDDAGLAVAAHTFFVPGNNLAEKVSNAEKSLDDACILGAPVVMIPPCPFLPNVMDPAENRKAWIEVLAEIAPLAEKRNLAFTVENFPGENSGFVTADDFYDAKRMIPSLKLTFDNGNAASGEDQIESLKRCFKDIVHVHFKDWDISDDPQNGRRMRDGRYYTPALIGEGNIDSKATLETLEELGYTGYINIEYENNKYPADEGIRRVLEFLRA